MLKDKLGIILISINLLCINIVMAYVGYYVYRTNSYAELQKMEDRTKRILSHAHVDCVNPRLKTAIQYDVPEGKDYCSVPDELYNKWKIQLNFKGE